MHSDTTDLALELNELVGVLLAAQPTNKPTWRVISSAIGLDAKTEAYQDFISAVLSRVAGLHTLAGSISGSPTLVERAQRVVGTADRLTHIFLSEGQSAPWSDSHGRLSVSDTTHLASFSPHARAARPLRLVEKSERDALIADVDASIEEIQLATYVDPWIRAALSREAKRLRTVLSHIEFFGHEFAVERTAVLAAKTAEVFQSSSSDGAQPLPKTYRLIATLAAAFIVPFDVSEASKTYLKWGESFAATLTSHFETSSGFPDPPVSPTGPESLALLPSAISVRRKNK
ncbi:hypothetical protein [uncultured Phenylobacterium sp.]|uniref:hypothetical protein n=1 Tax=uncultured Phenylobacterium sp. TaxID=349273 RepID=UPI0025ED02AA|nr:hypothetical protein [uncultured Phenylobacterium sp.]